MQQFVEVYNRIEAACARAGRPKNEVSLIAVTKRQAIGVIQAYIEFCAVNKLRCELGENYVQEWAEKKEHLKGDFSSHCIGHLQTNKLKRAVECFDSVQTIESMKQIKELSKIFSKTSNIALPYPIWVQVNISKDEGKSGVFEEELPVLVEEILLHTDVTITGLMTITRAYEDAEDTRRDFARLVSLAKHTEETLRLAAPLAISMGMSEDFELAIEEGATHVRVGSALFGQR